MAEFDVRWRLNEAPIATEDGSSVISHDFDVVYREAGTSDPWEVVSGKHLTIAIPAELLKAVLDRPDGPDKLNAYKAALIQRLNLRAIPVIGWANVDIDRHLQANARTAIEAARADEYILSIAGSYPVRFQIEI